MAISKVIYKTSAEDTGTVWMDVTQKTVTAASMLNGITSLKNDGTDITGNIASKTSSNLTASGATVTAPAGYYASDASKSVASGTEGTPTATKGTVSNHAVTVTPSVTNTAGYISGGTHTGTGVSVSVAELESGTKQITSNGTGISVSGYSKVDVSVSAPSPTLETVTKSYTPTESQQTETITPGSGYDGIGEVDVTVGAISSSYVGSGITRRDSTDLTASTLTVTAPAGYYASNATKTLSDQNLLAENIKKDISIFGVTGSYEGGGGTTWETVWSGTGTIYDEGTHGYIDPSVSPFTPIAQGDVYRVTWNGTPYVCTATEQLNYSPNPNETTEGYAIGNCTILGGTTGDNEPFVMTGYLGWGVHLMIFGTVATSGSATILVEKQVPASGGLEYESGTWTPAEDSNSPSISFSNSHSSAPFYVLIADETGTYDDTTYSMHIWTLTDFYNCFGYPDNYSTSSAHYAFAYSRYRYTSTTSTSGSTTAFTSSIDVAAKVNSNGFSPVYGSSYYYRSGRTYKWIAVWKPTT